MGIAFGLKIRRTHCCGGSDGTALESIDIPFHNSLLKVFKQVTGEGQHCIHPKLLLTTQALIV